MRKILFVFFTLLITLPIMAAEPGTIIKGQKADNSFGWIQITDDGYLKIDFGDGLSISADVFSNSQGVASSALIDSSRRIIINVASETLGLMDAVNIISAKITSNYIQAEAQNTIINAKTSDIASKVLNLSLQQATESLELIEAVSSITAMLPVASTTVSTFSTEVYTISLVSGAQEIDIFLTETDKEVWMILGGGIPTVGNGIPIRNSAKITKLNSSEVIKIIASETIGACWTQR